MFVFTAYSVLTVYYKMSLKRYKINVKAKISFTTLDFKN